MGTLHYRILDNVASRDLLERLTEMNCRPSSTPTFLFAQSSESYQIGMVREGQLWTAGGRIASDAYSIRLFCSTWEARWSRPPETGHGRLVLISDSTSSERSPSTSMTGRERRVDYLGTIDGSYLLWGEVLTDGNSASEVVLAEHRIGSLRLPLELARQTQAFRAGIRYRLESREYLGKVESGNMAVVEERLCGLSEAAPRKKRAAN